MDSGPSMSVPFAHYDPDSSSWRTSQLSLLEDSGSSSPTFTRAGSMRSGRLYERPTLVQRIVGSDCSSSRLLPTATCSDIYTANLGSTQQKPGSMYSVTLPQAVTRMLPEPLLKTPTSNLGSNGGSQHPDKRKAGGHGPSLQDEVEHLLPTAVTTDSFGARNRTSGRTNSDSKHHDGVTLSDVVWMQAGRTGESSTALSDGGNELSDGSHQPLLWADD